MATRAPGSPRRSPRRSPRIVRVAQKQYDDWTVDEEGYDEEVGGGGICHLIADEIVEVLDKHDVMATTVSSSHEVHVYVVARVPTGVWQIDIRPHVYERGGGYSWTKIPGVTFDASDVEVDRLSSNPRDFKEYVEDWQSDDEPDDEDTAGHGDAGAVEAGWRASLSNPDDVDRIVLGDMDHIVERAMAAGAKAPLEYIGAGMTSVVLRSGAQSYKVARNLSPTRHANFEDEAEFFAACMRVAWVREHVAELRGFDAQRLVIVKAYVPRDPTMRLSQYEHSLWEVHKKIERLMLPHGWGAPEFKNDSYIPTARGAVLVDGTFTQRCGKTLLKYARDLLDGRRPWWTETPRDLGFALRMEVGRTLTPEEIAPLEARLSAQHGDAATVRRKHGDTEREPLPSDVAEAFTALGRTQRGDPESAMNRVQEATGGGVMAYAVEHVGDLTHRMSHMAGWSGGGGDGYEYVHEKVKSCLRSLRNKYGFEREAHKNFENNARYQGVSIDKFMIGVNAALAGYVAEHRKIPVYNRAQWLARQAAIDLGQMKIRDTIWDLGALDDLLATKDKWRAAAFEYKRGADGELLQFPWPA